MILVKIRNNALLSLLAVLYLGYHALNASIEYSFDIPILGKASLTGDIDFATESFSFNGTLVGSQASLNIGPLTINRPSITLSNTKGLLLDAQGTLFDKSVVVGIKEFKQKNRIVLGATFISKPTLHIAQHAIELSMLDITLEEGKPITVTSTIEIFGKTALLSIGAGKETTLLEIKIPSSISVSDFDTSLTNNPLKEVSINQTTLTIKNPFGSKGPLSLELSGTINFSAFPLPLIENLSSLAMKGMYDPTNGLALRIALDKPISFGKAGSLENGSLLFFSQAQKNIPLFAQSLYSQQTEQQPSSDAATNLILTGNGEFNIPEIGSLRIEVFSKFINSAFDFTGKISSTKTLQPFKSTDLASLNSQDQALINAIELDNLTIGFSSQKSGATSQSTVSPNLFIQGTCSIFNLPLQAQLQFGANREGQKGLTLKARLPAGWKPSQSISSLAPFDSISFKDAVLLVSSYSYFDPEMKVMVQKGFSLFSTFNIASIIKGADRLIGKNTDALTVYGSISADGEMLLGASLPNLLTLSKGKIRSGGLSFILGIRKQSTPFVAFNITISVTPTEADEPLIFTAEIKPEISEALVSGTMQGFWNNPFGIEGFSIGDLALQMSINYVQFAATGLPSGAAVAGSIKLGTQEDSKAISVAANITENLQDLFIAGKLDGTLTMREIIDTAKMIAINKILFRNQDNNTPLLSNIDRDFTTLLNTPLIKELLDLSLSDVEIKLIPKGGMIGKLSYQQAVTLKGKIAIMGMNALLNFNLDSSGITTQGQLSPLIIGDVFSLKGVNNEGGPRLSLAVLLTKQYCVISGILEMLGMKRLVDFQLDKNGLSCNFSGELFKLFNAAITLKSRGTLSNPDLYFKASLQNEGLAFFTNYISEALKAELNTSIKKLEEPKKECDELIAQLDVLDKNMAALEQEMHTLEKTKPLDPRLTQIRFDLAGLKIKRFTLDSKHKAAELILQKTQQSLGWAGEAARKILTIAGNVALIKSFTIEGSIADIAAGKLPLVTITSEFLGFSKSVQLQLDLSTEQNARNSALLIGQALLATLKPK